MCFIKLLPHLSLFFPHQLLLERSLAIKRLSMTVKLRLCIMSIKEKGYADINFSKQRAFSLGLSPGVRQTAKALLTVRWNSIVIQKPFRARCASAGEAEAGSAGAQPAEE
jgi:hypothetical protein